MKEVGVSLACLWSGGFAQAEQRLGGLQWNFCRSSIRYRDGLFKQPSVPLLISVDIQCIFYLRCISMRLNTVY